ncbi:MAG: hypothetical protein ABSC94_31930 [Polyangiaceae bacterium]|jgi:hypothetical protein
MSKKLRRASATWILCTGALGWVGACSSNGNSPVTGGDGGHQSVSSSSTASSSQSSSGGDGSAGDATVYTYTLIDDMETTTHGPIEFSGVKPPETPGYWFNFGATSPCDVAIPPYTMFTFTALPTPTTTLDGKVSQHAAHQFCSLNGLYDVCGLGFEFAQLPDTDGGDAAACPVTPVAACSAGTADAGDAAYEADTAAAEAGDAAVSHADGGSGDAAVAHADGGGGDAGPSIPEMTVPFDISQYKGITFWGKAGADAGTIPIKILFPNTDTDPRGGVCNGAAANANSPCDTTLCYNSYAITEMFTGEWQQFTVLFSDLAIDPTFGYQDPNPFTGKNVYGVDWQGQDNDDPDAGPVDIDFWVDDVYFIQ